MRIFWLGFAIRYLAWVVSASRYSGLMSLLSKSKYTTRFASGLAGSSNGFTLTTGAGAAVATTGAGEVAGAGAVTTGGAGVGFACLVQALSVRPRASSSRP